MIKLKKKDITNIIGNKLSFLLPRIVGKELTTQILNEMLDYKGVEDEFGVDLITISKALKRGVFFISADKTIKHTNNLNLNHYCGNWSLSNKSYNLSLTEYGKKDYYGWALTKEELL